MARPTKYKEEFIDKVDEYLEECTDEQGISIVEGKDGKSKTVKKNVVRLPTIEGFALYLGVSKRSLYEWRDKYPEFLHALEKIDGEQYGRLIDKGLSGDYNSTIAKLMLSSNHGMRERNDVTSDDQPIQGNVVQFERFDESGN